MALVFAMGEGGTTYSGHDGTRRYMGDLDDAFEIGRADVDDALGVSDIAVLVGRIHYRGKGSGVEGESPTLAGCSSSATGRCFAFAPFENQSKLSKPWGARPSGRSKRPEV